MIIQEKTIACYECLGKGLVKREADKLIHGWEWEMKTCPICKGKKLLKRIVTIEYKTV